LIAARIVQHIDDIVGVLNRTIVDRKQQVAARHPDPIRGTPLGHFLDDDTFGTRRPQHTVFDLVPGGARSDVRDAKAQQARHDDDGQSRP